MGGEERETRATPAPGCPEAGEGRLFGGAGLVALVLGLAAGLVLYLPWDTVWHLALKRLAAGRPDLRVSWQNVDRAGPLSFRVNGLGVEGPGWIVSPRLQAVDVRLGVTPQVTLRVDSGGRVARVLYFESGSFDVQGQVNLACLGRRDIQGSVDVRAEGLVDRGRGALDRGLLDLRGAALTLPGSRWLGDAALALEFQDRAVRIRSFTLRAPVQVRAEGTAAVREGALLRSAYSVSGEFLRGRDAFPFADSGVLGDFLGHDALPE